MTTGKANDGALGDALGKYDAISPLDFRYYGSNKALFAACQPYLSERAFVAYQLEVEAALARTLAAHGLCPQGAAQEIAAACARVTAEEVYAEDARIRHATRAIVNCVRAKVSDAAKPYVHFTVTSFDVTDSANAARYKAFSLEVLVPALASLQDALIALALREKGTVQIGRTHGQHAVPITFGYAIAEYVERVGNAILRIEAAARGLRGKVAGAVGSHNAQALFIGDPERFERDVLAQLGLEPGRHATQIVAPEPLLGLLHETVVAHGIIANLADDMRHLQRTEIGEVAEEFGKDQVGSSTMPHKSNPWNFENVKSMWKETMPRIVTHYMDQICEHQRDLTNSASARFIPEILALVTESSMRMATLMGRLVVDRERIARNLAQSKESVIAEALYLLLAFHGHPDAHEAVRQKTLEAERTGKTLRELVPADEALSPYFARFTQAQRETLAHPETYVGLCAAKTERICAHWKAVRAGGLRDA